MVFGLRSNLDDATVDRRSATLSPPRSCLSNEVRMRPVSFEVSVVRMVSEESSSNLFLASSSYQTHINADKLSTRVPQAIVAFFYSVFSTDWTDPVLGRLELFAKGRLTYGGFGHRIQGGPMKSGLPGTSLDYSAFDPSVRCFAGSDLPRNCELTTATAEIEHWIQELRRDAPSCKGSAES